MARFVYMKQNILIKALALLCSVHKIGVRFLMSQADFKYLLRKKKTRYEGLPNTQYCLNGSESKPAYVE